jgi:hypothetical protein
VITPSKFVSLDVSVLSKLDVILQQGPGPLTIGALLARVRDDFESLDQFMLTLDVLYLLQKIDVNPSSGMLKYVD